MRYEIERQHTYRVNDEGERELLANFEAEIAEETRYVDGVSSKTVLIITGRQMGPIEDRPVELTPVRVPAEDFAGLGWVMPNWGVRAVIRPGSGIKEDLRTAIQLRSAPIVMTIYKHLGWTEINGKKAFLHAGGAMKENGNDKSIRVQLPLELSRYNLDAEGETADALKTALELLKIGPKEVTWCLLAASIAPLFGPVDFGIHLSGRTGTFKSEVMSLFQSLYGSGMDARHLPGSWSSTANALEAQAFLAANAAFVIDDFVPNGNSAQVRAYQQGADKIIRAQGNQAGRARLTDVSDLQQTMYPRGIILSTGEDTPEGHSVRARMLILELSPGDIELKQLTKVQGMRKILPVIVGAIVRKLIEVPADITPRVEDLRNGYIDIGHTRTPAMLGRLVAVIEWFLEFVKGEGVISDQVQKKMRNDAIQAIESAGKKQQSYLEEADPVDMFTSAVRQVLATGLGHIRTLNGGIPLKAAVLGWTEENASGAMPTFKSRGPSIGWVKWSDDEIFIDVVAGWNIIKKVMGSEMQLNKNTLFRRLKDAGLLKRTDDARQRNTVRITAEVHPRNVLVLAATELLQNQEIPNGEEEEERDGNNAGGNDDE